MEATLGGLEKEREAEAAWAEAAVMEAAAADFEATNDNRTQLMPMQSAQQCMEECISRHSSLSGSMHLLKDSRDEYMPRDYSPHASVCEEREDKFPAPEVQQPSSRPAVNNAHAYSGLADRHSCPRP